MPAASQSTAWGAKRVGGSLLDGGFFLCERAQELKSPSGRRRLWAQNSEDTGLPLGVEFAEAAAHVLGLLSTERESVLRLTKTPSDSTSPSGRRPDS